MSKHVIVHKEGQEGVLTVDRMTGKITTPMEERPDWAEGLAAALIQERLTFYQMRLGKESAHYQEIANAEAIAADDLGWVGLNAEGEEVEIEADEEHRSEVVAQCLGVNTEEGTFGDTLVEMEISRENRGRTASEMAALEQAKTEGFGEAPEQSNKATGSR